MMNVNARNAHFSGANIIRNTIWAFCFARGHATIEDRERKKNEDAASFQWDAAKPPDASALLRLRK